MAGQPPLPVPGVASAAGREGEVVLKGANIGRQRQRRVWRRLRRQRGSISVRISQQRRRVGWRQAAAAAPPRETPPPRTLLDLDARLDVQRAAGRPAEGRLARRRQPRRADLQPAVGRRDQASGGGRGVRCLVRRRERSGAARRSAARMRHAACPAAAAMSGAVNATCACLGVAAGRGAAGVAGRELRPIAGGDDQLAVAAARRLHARGVGRGDEALQLLVAPPCFF